MLLSIEISCSSFVLILFRVILPFVLFLFNFFLLVGFEVRSYLRDDRERIMDLFAEIVVLIFQFPILLIDLLQLFLGLLVQLHVLILAFGLFLKPLDKFEHLLPLFGREVIGKFHPLCRHLKITNILQ